METLKNIIDKFFGNIHEILIANNFLVAMFSLASMFNTVFLVLCLQHRLEIKEISYWLCIFEMIFIMIAFLSFVVYFKNKLANFENKIIMFVRVLLFSFRETVIMFFLSFFIFFLIFLTIIGITIHHFATIVITSAIINKKQTNK